MVLWGNMLLEIEIPILKLGILCVYHIRIIKFLWQIRM